MLKLACVSVRSPFIPFGEKCRSVTPDDVTIVSIYKGVPSFTTQALAIIVVEKCVYKPFRLQLE